MAEVVGLVASVVTLGEVASKVVALKGLWEQVRNVPRCIQDQLDQLEALNAVMAEVEAQAERNAALGIPTGLLSLRYCERAAKELDEVIQELQRQITSNVKFRRALAKVKVVLEQESIVRAQKRLQDALQIMQLALTLHVCSLTEAVPERTASIVFALQDEQNATAGNKPTFESIPFLNRGRNAGYTMPPLEQSLPWLKNSILGSITTGGRSAIHRKSSDALNNQTIIQARIRLPSWLTNKAWDVVAYRSTQGFTWNLCSWNVRPDDSPIFDAVEGGLVPELMDIISSGNGSLYDRTSDGLTLLHLAALMSRFDMATTLIKMGHLLLERTTRGGLPIEMNYPPDHALVKVGDALDLYMGTFSQGDFDRDIEMLYGLTPSDEMSRPLLLKYIWSVPGLLKQIDVEMGSRFKSLPVESKLALFDWLEVDPSVLASIIAENDITLDDIWLGEKPSSHRSLHYFICSYFFCTVRYFIFYYHERRKEQFRSKFREWKELALSMLSGKTVDHLGDFSGPLFNWQGDFFRTSPLLYSISTNMSIAYTFTSSLIDARERQYLLRKQLEIARGFLDIVSKAGIDLEEYGQREVDIFRSEELLWTCRCTEMHYSPLYLQPDADGPYLTSISYGPTPDDWDFHWDIMAEEFVGDFWDMLEREQLKVPGAWVD